MGTQELFFRWGGNRYGNHLIWLDDNLKDLDMHFMVRSDGLGGWKALISVVRCAPYLTDYHDRWSKHGFPTKMAAQEYCEEYLAEEYCKKS